MSLFGVAAEGFVLQASLILALGAQNIFVLNSGLRRQRHLLVAFVSSACDTFLIFVGVLGIATVFAQVPILKVGLGFAGVGFLFFYGFLKIKEARKGVAITPGSEQTTSVKQTVLAALGFSLLNPHVYLDAVVLIGGYSSKYEHLTERVYFGAGASIFSVIWFYGLSLLASTGSRLLSNPRAMRIVSLISGFILVTLAIKLGTDVLSWIHN